MTITHDPKGGETMNGEHEVEKLRIRVERAGPIGKPETVFVLRTPIGGLIGWGKDLASLMDTASEIAPQAIERTETTSP